MPKTALPNFCPNWLSAVRREIKGYDHSEGKALMGRPTGDQTRQIHEIAQNQPSRQRIVIEWRTAKTSA